MHGNCFSIWDIKLANFVLHVTSAESREAAQAEFTKMVKNNNFTGLEVWIIDLGHMKRKKNHYERVKEEQWDLSKSVSSLKSSISEFTEITETIEFGDGTFPIAENVIGSKLPFNLDDLRAFAIEFHRLFTRFYLTDNDDESKNSKDLFQVIDQEPWDYIMKKR